VGTVAVAEQPLRPGRSCPLHYRYSSEVFRALPTLTTDTLYVVGGLYGNPHALEALMQATTRERGDVQVVFNGDFHWFDIDPADFTRIHQATLDAHATRGNVETELASDGHDGGCGCGYPDSVDDAEVDRSNRILARLRMTARSCLPAAERTKLAALPMYALAEVGECRVAVVHGDWESLAGWRFSSQNLHDPAGMAMIASAFEAADVDIFASSHTCLPALNRFRTARGTGVVINNGAAGMPNFRGALHGLVTRIGVKSSPDAIYGTRVRGVHVEALPLRYDVDAWMQRFLQNWPAGSPANLSYLERIRHGPAFDVAAATGATST
jgi:hypothetical protein